MFRTTVAALCSLCLTACTQVVPTPAAQSPAPASPTPVQPNPSPSGPRAESRSPMLEAFEEERSGKAAEKQRYVQAAFFQSVPADKMRRDLDRIEQQYEQRKQEQFDATVRRMQRKSDLPWER